MMKNNLKNRILSMVLCICMVLSLMPGFAYGAAATDAPSGYNVYNVEDGSLPVDGYGVPTLTISESGNYYVYGTGKQTTARIQVNGGVTATVLLADVNLKMKQTVQRAAIQVDSGANLTLRLSGKNRFYGGPYSAGINVRQGSTLKITSASGDGKTDGELTAVAYASTYMPDVGLGAAGIGANGITEYEHTTGIHQNVGDIIIAGGTVNATGGGGGAAIGGGGLSYTGSITVTGGVINCDVDWLSRYSSGAGIGSGFASYMPSVKISGGLIRVGKTYAAAAVGGGYSGRDADDRSTLNGEIVITGGTIIATASGEVGAASIGAGGVVTIDEGGTIDPDNIFVNPVQINGGSFYEPDGVTNPINAAGVPLVRKELTVNGLESDTTVDAITFSKAYNYSLKDVYTIDGKLCLYLPEEILVQSVTIGGKQYDCNSEGLCCDHPELAAANCQKGPVCRICGFELPGKDANNHTSYMTAYRPSETDKDEHEIIYVCCQAVKSTKSHRYSDGVCSDCHVPCYHKYHDGKCSLCGAPCPHTYENSVCTLCGMACPHDYVRTAYVAPTHGAQGYASYACNDCGHTYHEVLDSIAHEFVYEYYSSTEHCRKCAGCNYTLFQEHDFLNNPTCKCVCGAVQASSAYHHYEATVIEPDCTQMGYTEYICTDCGKSYRQDYTFALGHKGGQKTCTEQAICQVCGEHYGEMPAGHNEDWDDDNCLTPVYCLDCGTVVTPAMEEHTWNEYSYCDVCYTGMPCTYTFVDDGQVLFTEQAEITGYYSFRRLENKNGLSFLGWDADGDGIQDYAGASTSYDIYVEGDHTFTAVYGNVYLVEYFRIGLDSGEYEAANIQECQENETLYLDYDYAYWYQPLGWATEPGGPVVYEFGQEIQVTESLKLYTVCRAFQAVVDLDAEDAVWNDENGEPITTLGEGIFYHLPTRPGYSFLGFRVVPGYGGEYTCDVWVDEETQQRYIELMLSDDVTLIALWGHFYTSQVTDPTCTDPGYTTYTCTDCDDSYVDDPVPALGHDWIDGTCTTPKLCRNCLMIESEAPGHSYENGSCTVCGQADPSQVAQPEISLQFPTVSFKDELLMNVYFDVSDMSNVVDMGLITYSSQVDSWSIHNAEKLLPGYRYNSSVKLYSVTTQGISAKNMGDEIWFAVYVKLSNGVYCYSKLASYSAAKYAYALLGTEGAKLDALLVSMLNYGAAAQLYFGYHVDHLVNKDLTEEQKALVSEYTKEMITASAPVPAEKQGIFADDKSFTNKYATTTFGGAFALNYYGVPGADPVDGLTMYYWDEAAYAANDVLTPENASSTMEMTLGNQGAYVGSVRGIPARKLNTTQYVAFVYSDGTTTHTSGILPYSVSEYCSYYAGIQHKFTDLAKTTAVYGHYASEYFG